MTRKERVVEDMDMDTENRRGTVEIKTSILSNAGAVGWTKTKVCKIFYLFIIRYRYRLVRSDIFVLVSTCKILYAYMFKKSYTYIRTH